MAAPKLFLTGVTGYIGGSVLAHLQEAHPEYEYTVLMRKESADFKAAHPDVRVVYGDFDDLELLEREAERADVVIHSGNSDHMPAIKALLRGSAKNLNQTYLIHLSGTGTIADTLSFPTGDLNPRIWSDIQDIKAIQSLPEGAMHRHVDKLLQEFAEQDGERENVNIAIMCPPDIYGTGTGTGYRYSYMVPFFVKTVLERGDSFYLGKGENTRSVVHVEDLARLYGKVVEDAVSGEKKVGWGKDAFLFASSEDIAWKDVAEVVGRYLNSKGIIGDAVPKSVDPAEADAMMEPKGIVRYMFGSNSRSRPDRAKESLGWSPSASSFFEELNRDVDSTLELEGKLKGTPAKPKGSQK